MARGANCSRYCAVSGFAPVIEDKKKKKVIVLKGAPTVPGFIFLMQSLV